MSAVTRMASTDEPVVAEATAAEAGDGSNKVDYGASAVPAKKARLAEVEAALSSRQGFTSEIFKIELRGLPK